MSRIDLTEATEIQLRTLDDIQEKIMDIINFENDVVMTKQQLVENAARFLQLAIERYQLLKAL